VTDSQGFWSYVHADDDADGGRIIQLAHDIVAQYEMLSNETVELFLDRDGIVWGADWERRIETSLATIAFFIPTLTPRYFASPSCRNELNSFARRATDLGVQELLLPILYMDVPGLEDDPPSDDLLALVKRFQWVDWRELRFADRFSSEYRRAVASLAERLVAANRTAEATGASDAAISHAESLDDEAGVIELLAGFEAALPRLTATTQAIGEAIREVGQVVQSTNEVVALDQGGANAFARRLQILRKLSIELADPSSRISTLGDDFAQQLHDVDLGIRAIIARAPEEPENKSEFCSFFEVVRSMVTSSNNGLGALQGMVDSTAPLEKLSRDIRPPLRDMRRGLTLMVEGRDVMRPWVALMDASGLDCQAPPDL
jgi:hypothetical protein